MAVKGVKQKTEMRITVFEPWQNPNICLLVLPQAPQLPPQPLSCWLCTPQRSLSRAQHFPTAQGPALASCGRLALATTVQEMQGEHCGLHTLSPEQLRCYVCLGLFVQLVQFFFLSVEVLYFS